MSINNLLHNFLITKKKVAISYILSCTFFYNCKKLINPWDDE